MTLGVLTACLVGHYASFELTEEEKIAWIKSNAIPITSTSPDEMNFEDISPILKFISSADVVMLGEPSHGDGTIFDLKVRLIKLLHQKSGFNVVAWESGQMGSERILNGSEVQVDEKTRARRGIFPLWADTHCVQNLVKYGLGSQASFRPLEMTGFDPQLTGIAIDEISKFLIYIIEPSSPSEEFKSHIQAIVDQFKKYQGGDKAAKESLKKTLDQLSNTVGSLIDENCPVRAKNDLITARRYIDDLLTMHEVLSADMSKPSQEMYEKAALRDKRMSENLSWLLENSYKDKKIVCWGANTHFSKNLGDGGPPPVQQFFESYTSMGEWFNRKYPGRAYSVGMTAYQGEIGTFGSKPEKLEPAPTDSFEYLCEKTGIKNLFIDFRSLPENHWLRGQIVARFQGYSPIPGNWVNQFDGVVFVRDISPPN